MGASHCKSLQEGTESTPLISIYHQIQTKIKTKQQLRGVRSAITSLLIWSRNMIQSPCIWGKTIVKSTFFHFNPLMFLIDLIALYENNNYTLTVMADDHHLPNSLPYCGYIPHWANPHLIKLLLYTSISHRIPMKFPSSAVATIIHGGAPGLCLLVYNLQPRLTIVIICYHHNKTQLVIYIYITI